MDNNKLILSVVVPTYNEEKRIEKCLINLRAYFFGVEYPYEIIVSDDGSIDKTKEIVSKYQKAWPKLRLLENTHKGKAPTVISGIFDAKGEYVLMTDVDLSVGIGEFDKFYPKLFENKYDLIIASREGNGAKRINEPLTRHIMGRVFNLLVQLLVLPGINDTQCGFKLFRSESIRNVFKHTKLYSLEDKEIKGGRVSAFDVEMLYVSKLLGYKTLEIPVVWTYADASKVHNLKDSYYNAKDVIMVRLFKLTGQYKV